MISGVNFGLYALSSLHHSVQTRHNNSLHCVFYYFCEKNSCSCYVGLLVKHRMCVMMISKAEKVG